MERVDISGENEEDFLKVLQYLNFINLYRREKYGDIPESTFDKLKTKDLSPIDTHLAKVDFLKEIDFSLQKLFLEYLSDGSFDEEQLDILSEKGDKLSECTFELLDQQKMLFGVKAFARNPMILEYELNKKESFLDFELIHIGE